MSIFGLQTNGIYVHADDATGLEWFQEVLGRRRRVKNCYKDRLSTQYMHEITIKNILRNTPDALYSRNNSKHITTF